MILVQGSGDADSAGVENAAVENAGLENVGIKNYGNRWMAELTNPKKQSSQVCCNYQERYMRRYWRSAVYL